MKKVIMSGVLIASMMYAGLSAAYASSSPFATSPVVQRAEHYINVQTVNSSAHAVSSALNSTAVSSLWATIVSWINAHLGIDLPKLISAVQSFFTFLMQQTLSLIHSIK
ncbi:hypothetical protein M1534_01575 [Patescibacteria group bacterium]|nr:hypothetical protein [Patescibacteria group bacterium]